MKKKMKKLLAIVIVISLCLSCATINVGAGALPYKCFLGDVNGNGILTIEDVTAVQRYLAEMVTWKYIMRVLADYDHNDKVNVKDVTAIQRAVAELPQPEGYGGYYWSDNALMSEFNSDYLSGSMPVGSTVTFTVNTVPEATHVFCVDDIVAQPRSASNTFTYTFTEPGYHYVSVCAFINTGSSRKLCWKEIAYLIPENMSDTDLRINRVDIDSHLWDQSPFIVQYGAAGGVAPYTYSLTLVNSTFFDNDDDFRVFNAYLATHETEWQLRYNESMEYYEWYRDFSADDVVAIDKQMLDFYYHSYYLTIQVKDAQGNLSKSRRFSITAELTAG